MESLVRWPSSMSREVPLHYVWRGRSMLALSLAPRSMSRIPSLMWKRILALSATLTTSIFPLYLCRGNWFPSSRYLCLWGPNFLLEDFFCFRGSNSLLEKPSKVLFLLKTPMNLMSWIPPCSPYCSSRFWLPAQGVLASNVPIPSSKVPLTLNSSSLRG